MAFDGLVARHEHPPPQVLHAAEAIYAEHQRSNPLAAVPELAALLAQYPGCERLHVLRVRLLDHAQGRAATIAAWRDLADQFPLCHEAVAIVLRWSRQTRGVEAARLELRWRCRARPLSAERALLQARAWASIGEDAHAKRCFRTLLRIAPGYEPGYVRFAQWLRRSDPWEASRVVGTGLDRLGERRALLTLQSELAADLLILQRLPNRRPRDPVNVAGRVLAHLIEQASPAPPGRHGTVLMLTGTLGPGGAERQLVNTAISLDRLARPGSAAGLPFTAVEVWCRSLSDRPRADFFMAQLARQGVPVRVYGALPPAEAATVLPDGLAPLLRFLPADVFEATLRLTGELRRAQPAIVHLWQDGTILVGALAAVLAGVPRILLSVRTAPPPDRPERHRPEYLPLYRALLRRPGTVLVSNSSFAASRYTDWIGLPDLQPNVIYNGVAPLRRTGRARTRALLKDFHTRTGTGFTVGAIMRLDANKRPLFWIDCAALLLSSIKDARFIMLGNGPFHEEMQAYANSVGLGHRILFVGHSDEVGFWLHQMDVLLLLSRHEGLPNVLIEAQSLGVPVVTTPAGGAPETLLDGETGHVLSSAETPCIDETVRCHADLASNPERRRRMSVRARRFARRAFSLDSMVASTIEAYRA